MRMVMRIRVTTRADLFEERKRQHIERGYRIEDERPIPVNGLCSFVAIAESGKNGQTPMSLKIRFRFDGRCAPQPRYDPKRDGRPSTLSTKSEQGQRKAKQLNQSQENITEWTCIQRHFRSRANSHSAGCLCDWIPIVAVPSGVPTVSHVTEAGTFPARLSAQQMLSK